MQGAILLLSLLVLPDDEEACYTFRKIERTKVDFSSENASLEEIVAFLRDLSGLNMVIDEAARAKVDAERKVTFKVKDLPLKKVLGLIQAQYGLVYRVTPDDVVLLTTPGQPGLVLELHDARSIFTRLCDSEVLAFIFGVPAPAASLFAPGEASGDPLELLQFIEAHVAPGTWSGARTLEVTPDFRLLVNQTSAAQAELRKLLERLSAFEWKEWEHRRRSHFARVLAEDERLEARLVRPLVRKWQARAGELLDRFDDQDLPTRAAAEAELVRAGKEARPFVEPEVRRRLAQAERSGDFEVAGRCRAVLEGMGPARLRDTLEFWHAMTRQ